MSKLERRTYYRESWHGVERRLVVNYKTNEGSIWAVIRVTR